MFPILAMAAAFALVAVMLFSKSRLDSRPAFDTRERHVAGEVHLPLFWQAFAVRLMLALAIRQFGLADFFAPDQSGYEAGGKALSAQWSSTGAVSYEAAIGRFGQATSFYHYLNAIGFHIGLGPWLPIATNCLLGAFTPTFTSSITRRLGGNASAQRYAALLAAFFPSLVLWSSINIRDVWALAAILFAIDSALALHDRLSPTRLAAFTAAMLTLGVVRSYMFVLVGAGLSISLISSISLSRFRGFVAATVTALACLYLYSATGFGAQFVEEASFERIAAIREGMTRDASSAYLTEADVSSPGRAFAFLPIGLAHFWLGPFPWQVRGLRQAVTVPELLALYALLFYLVRGYRWGLRVAFSKTVMLIGVIGMISAAYALIQGNYGTAYRHRAQALAPCIALIAVGLAHRSYTGKRVDDRGLRSGVGV